MYLTTLGAATALASVGQAFLLPPTISLADSEIVNVLPFEDAIAADGVLMDVHCPGCPIAFEDTQGQQHATNVENQLQFNFQVVHEETEKVVVNGLQIFPIEPTSDSFMQTLTAPQLMHNDDDTWSYAAEPRLGYSLGVKEPIRTDENKLNLITIHMEIVEVGNTFVQGIPAMEIYLLQSPSGKLTLGNAILIDAEDSDTPSDNDQECSTLLCKWRAIIAEKLPKLRKGCHKASPRPNATVDGPKVHESPPHRRPHGHHRHHRQRHTLLRFLRNVTIHVLLPVAAGVAVGITASLVGMLVGNIIVLIWRLLFRRNQAQYQIIPVEEIFIIEESDEKTKSLLIEEPQGPPPTYTDEKV